MSAGSLDSGDGDSARRSLAGDCDRRCGCRCGAECNCACRGEAWTVETIAGHVTVGSTCGCRGGVVGEGCCGSAVGAPVLSRHATALVDTPRMRRMPAGPAYADDGVADAGVRVVGVDGERWRWLEGVTVLRVDGVPDLEGSQDRSD